MDAQELSGLEELARRADEIRQSIESLMADVRVEAPSFGDAADIARAWMGRLSDQLRERAAA